MEIKNDKLLKLVIMQHILIHGITSSFSPDSLSEKEQQAFFSAIYTYMDVFSMSVITDKIELPESLQTEIKEWIKLYDEKEMEEVKEFYNELSNEYDNLTKKKEEVKEDDLDISSEEEK